MLSTAFGDRNLVYPQKFILVQTYAARLVEIAAAS